MRNIRDDINWMKRHNDKGVYDIGMRKEMSMYFDTMKPYVSRQQAA